MLNVPIPIIETMLIPRADSAIFMIESQFRKSVDFIRITATHTHWKVIYKSKDRLTRSQPQMSSKMKIPYGNYNCFVRPAIRGD